MTVGVVGVVGAGLAGLRTCEALRALGYGGRIVLAGAEPHPPYTRPPLSKQILRGDADAATVTLRTAEELAAIDVELRTSTRAVSLTVAERAVGFADGSVLECDHVVVATGARARALPGPPLPGVHRLRTLDDCLALRARLVPGARVVVVGAGFVGLEVAASGRQMGCEVTVVEPLATPLARVLDPALGAAIGRLHAEHGVSTRCAVGVRAAAGDGRVERVGLTDGATLDADVMVVGIGARPATRWLCGSGLTLDDGLVCDSALRAAPGVWAVGDVARWRSPRLRRPVRVEHWTNATEQPRLVARNIVAGAVEPFEAVPYFWSDQYDAKLACLGHVGRGDEVRVVRGSLDDRSWVALVRCGDRLGGVVGLRAPGQVMRLRPLLAQDTPWAEAVALAS